MRTKWRWRAATLVVMVACCACGDSGPSASTEPPVSTPASVEEPGSAPVGEASSPPVEEAGPTPVEFGDAVVASVGADGALAAVLYALDAGYSLEQLVPAAFAGTLDATGDIAGVDPAEPPYGLIAPNPERAGFVRSLRTTDTTPSATYSVDEVQSIISTRLATLTTVNLLGAPLGVGGEFDYDDVFGAEPTRVTEATRDEATAMIGVLVALIDVGYTFDQALEGWLFGDVEMAIGYDPTGTTFTGVSLGDKPVAVCLTLRDGEGKVVTPGGDGPTTMFGSATCASAIRNGTISYDGLDALRVAAGETDTAEPAGHTDTDDAPTPPAAPVTDVAAFDGIYTSNEIERDLGAIVEVLDTVVDVSVSNGVIDGAMIQTSIVVFETTLPAGSYTKTEEATQTVLLFGSVDPSGMVSGEGNTSADYVLLACAPEEACLGVSATQGPPEGVAVSFSGSIVGDTMEVEVVNSVSGATFTFRAER